MLSACKDPLVPVFGITQTGIEPSTSRTPRLQDECSIPRDGGLSALCAQALPGYKIDEFFNVQSGLKQRHCWSPQTCQYIDFVSILNFIIHHVMTYLFTVVCTKKVFMFICTFHFTHYII